MFGIRKMLYNPIGVEKLIAMLVLCCVCSGAELGTDIARFNDAFRLDAREWSVQQTSVSTKNNLLLPNDNPEFTFFIKPDRPFSGMIKLEVIRYGIHSQRGKDSRPVLIPTDIISAAEMETTLPAEGGSLTFAPQLGDAFGGYALIVELEGLGRHFAASVTRSLEAPSGLISSTPVNGPSSDDAVLSQLCTGQALRPISEDAPHQIPSTTSNTIPQVWSSTAAVAATEVLIGQRPFNSLLFKTGLPWVFIFDGLPSRPNGKPNPDDGTLVIIGDLKNVYPADALPLRSVQVYAGASLSIANTKDQFQLYDLYGNPLETVGGKIILPLNTDGYFLRTRGAKGSFKRLLNAVKAADIHNIAPVEITVTDFNSPVTKPETTLNVRVSNVLNQKTKGTLNLLVPGVVFKNDFEELTLRPHQTRELEFEVVFHLSQNRDGNNYPLIVTWTGAEETTPSIKHAETIHVNSLQKMTPTVDGKLDDWDSMLPLSTFTPVGEHDTDLLYQPFRDWPLTTERNTVSAWIAWDDDALYLAARTHGFKASSPDGKFYNLLFALGPETELTLNLLPDGTAELRQLRPLEQPILGSQQVIKGRVAECTIPWSALPQIHERILKGTSIEFNYRSNAGDTAWELANGRSTSICISPKCEDKNSFQWANRLKIAIGK